jgi:hypothetical protein
VRSSVSGSVAEGKLIKLDGTDQTLFIILMGFLKSPFFRISALSDATYRYSRLSVDCDARASRARCLRTSWLYNDTAVTLDAINSACNQLGNNAVF